MRVPVWSAGSVPGWPQLSVRHFGAYRSYVAGHPEEHAALCAAVPVLRTEFFRDPVQWTTATAVSASLLRREPARAPVHVWSAGCASGEEAYSLAITFAESVGLADLRHRVQIRATDVSEAALEKAHAGTYAAWRLRKLSRRIRDTYFALRGDHWVVRDELRRAVTFARHDLLVEPPPGRVDLVTCRNVLPYFAARARGAVVASLQETLAPGGVLFAGAADAPSLVRERFLRLAAGWHFYRTRVEAQLPDVDPDARARRTRRPPEV